MSQSVPTSSHAQNLTGQTVNYFGPVLKGAENGTTIIQFDLRQHDFHQELGTQAPLWWRQEASHVEVHELSTFHNPMTYRCIIAQGSSLDDQHQQKFFTPEIQGVSTSQPMSHSVIRLACYLAVVCGVSLRHIALLLAALFLIPVTKSSIKRWMDAIGTRLPTPEEMLRHQQFPLTALHPLPSMSTERSVAA